MSALPDRGSLNAAGWPVPWCRAANAAHHDDDVKMGNLTGLLGKIKPAVAAASTPASATPTTMPSWVK
jgi:hypothetical protein